MRINSSLCLIMAEDIHFKFSSWNGPGHKLQRPVLRSIDDSNSIVKIESNEDFEKNKLGESLKSIVEEFGFKIDQVDKLLQSGKYLEKDEVGENNALSGSNRLSDIYDRWLGLNDRYESGEREVEMMTQLEKCKSDLELLERDIEKWKENRMERKTFLEKNKDWSAQFVEAETKVLEFGGTQDEFEATYVNKRKERDFPFNVKKEFLNFAKKTDEEILELDEVELKSWKKLLGAAKMINSTNIPKTVVIFEGVAYGVDAEKNKKLESRQKAVEFLNKLVVKKLKTSLGKIEPKTVFARAMKDSDFRYMAFVIGKEVIEDENILKRLISDNFGDPLSKEEGDKIDVAIEKLLENDAQMLNGLILRTFVYNETGKAISTIKSLSSEEKSLKQAELVDRILESFDAELKEKINKNFIEKRKAVATSGAQLNQAQRDEIKKAIKSFVKIEFAEAVPAVTVSEPIAPEDKVEAVAKETEKSHALDELVALLHKLVEDLAEKKKGMLVSDYEKFDKFFEKVNVTFHELHDEKFDDAFKVKAAELKKNLEDKIQELSQITVNVNEVQEKKLPDQLSRGNEAAKKLFASWNRLSDFERESPEFEGIYILIDTLGANLFKDEFERLNSSTKLSAEEKQDRIERKITYLQSMLEMVEKKLKEADLRSGKKSKNNSTETDVVENETGKSGTSEKVSSASEEKENVTPESQGIFERKGYAQSENERGLLELKRELDIVRKKYDEIYAEKSERYKIVLKGLGGNSRYEALMLEDPDIRFYRNDYHQILTRYLEASFDDYNSRTDSIIKENEDRGLKKNWIETQWQNFLSKFSFRISAEKKETLRRKRDEALLESEDGSNSESTLAKENTVRFNVDNRKQEFEYVGGFNRLRNDLFILMSAVMGIDKKIIESLQSGQRKELFRDLKISDILKGEKVNDFGILPQRGQILIRKLSEINQIGLNDPNLTLRDFVKKTLEFVKSEAKNNN